jgi:hypothetical protein
MATVMNENDVTSFAVFNDPIKGIQNIFLSRRTMAPIVHQNQHILFFKSLILDQISLDIVGVVMATTQLPLLAFVIYTDKNRLPRTNKE